MIKLNSAQPITIRLETISPHTIIKLERLPGIHAVRRRASRKELVMWTNLGRASIRAVMRGRGSIP